MTDYFYTPPESVSGDLLTIGGEEFNHLIHVMRKKVGDQIRVVDGRGNAFEATITSIRKREATAAILNRYPNHNESRLEVTIGVGVLKNPSKFDFLVEKVTEIGVRTIVPLATARTIPDHARTSRWQKLALAAMKQCGRSYLPTVTELRPLEDIINDSPKPDCTFVCHSDDGGSESLVDAWRARSAAQSVKPIRVLLLIGPEGGFTDEEISLCRQSGAEIVSLGARRLRTETAAICAAGLVLLSNG